MLMALKSFRKEANDMAVKDKYEQWEKEIVYQLNKRDVMCILIAIPEMKMWRLKEIEDFCDEEVLPRLDLNYDRDIRELVANRLDNSDTWPNSDQAYETMIDHKRESK